jgi:D-alanyl-D-alanine carboxypeptidase
MKGNLLCLQDNLEDQQNEPPEVRMSQNFNIQTTFRITKWKYMLPVLLFLFLLWGCDQALQVQDELPFAGELQAELDSARESLGLVGVSAAVIVPGYEPWWGGSGESHPGQPVTREMLFDTASAGKILVGPLMVKLAEDGLISLDDPLEIYLPDFPYVDGDITLRQLLNHTSGLPMMTRHPDSPFRVPYREIDHERWWTVDEIFTELKAEPDFTPGEDWCYTQAGYQIATLIVESVTGETVGEAIQTRLLDPLDIQGMYLEYAEPRPPDLLFSHPWVDLDYDGDFEDVSAESRSWIASLSRIFFYATPEDLAAWTHALFNGEVLNQDSMVDLLDFYRMDDTCGEPPIFTGYGMGVLDFEPALFAGHQAWGHIGSVPGYRTLVASLPDFDVTLAFMTNTDSDDAAGLVEPLLGVVLENLEGGVGELPPVVLQPVSHPPDDAPVFATFQKESLFCDQDPQWELVTSTEDWIDLSLEWVVGTDETLAEVAWDHHEHTITVNGMEIPDLETYTHEVQNYTVTCPDQTLEVWAKGLSIYLPPLPEGEYQIRWYSQITGEFDNGWVTYQPGDYMEITAELEVK